VIRISRLKWYVKKAALIFAWLLRDWIATPRLKFYFSSSSWEASIRRTFKWTKHQVEFGDIREASKLNPDVVIPLNMDDVYFVSNEFRSFPYNRLPATREVLISLLNDKGRFNDWLNHSKFFRLSLATRTQPPFMLKPRQGQYGEGCKFIVDEPTYTKYKKLILSDDFLCQEVLISHKEYATHLLVNNGKILRSICVEYTFPTSLPIKGVDSPDITRIVSESFPHLWSELMMEISYSGICCINYKICNGDPKLMEINPRFGGSLAEYFFTFSGSIARIGIPSY